MQIKLTAIPLSDTLVPDKYNSNNHHVLGITYGHVLTEEEYNFYKAQSARHTWEHLQPQEGVLEHELTKSDLITLREATISGALTGRRPEAFKEELDALEAKLPLIKPPKKYFARLSEYSPKDGEGGCGPFTSRSAVVDSLATSARCLKTYKKDKTTKLYLVPWREDWHQPGSVEFRVFCYHGKTTAISQYNWMKDVGLSEFLSDLESATTEIANFCENDIIPKLSNVTQGNWTIDVVFNFATKKTELVEVNSFGCELAAGSALFHWVRDMDVMYGKAGYVEFRYEYQQEEKKPVWPSLSSQVGAILV